MLHKPLHSILLALIITFTSIPLSATAESLGRAFSLGDGRDVATGFWKLAFSENSAGKVRPQRSHLPTEEDSAIGIALPICAESKTTACIDSLEVRMLGEEWQSAKVLPAIGQRYYDYGSCCEEPLIDKRTSEWRENTSKKLPAGSTSRLWSLPIPHAGGSDYLVSVGFSGFGSGVKNQSSFRFDEFEASITPVVVTTNSDRTTCRDGQLEESEQGGNGPCIRAYDFPVNTEYRLKVYLGSYSSNLSGWLDARIIEGRFTFDKRKKLLTIQGQPAIVPVAATNEISIAEVEADPKLCAISSCSGTLWKEMKKSSIGIFGGVESNSRIALDQFRGIEKYLPEKSLGNNTVWRFSSLPTSGDFSICAPKGEFSGIVSTNATVYASGPPRWLKKTSEVSFELGATHLLQDGDKFLGYYKLFLSEAVAKCIWGNNLVGSQARVEILENGKEVSTNTSAVKLANGWVAFEAEGFTFSTPDIRVALIGKKQMKSNASSVVCAKGKVEKLIKNVPGTSVKCPTGFKRK